MIRLATLSKSDLAFIRQHRGLPNRLGVAVQMVYLRHPGRALGVREIPHARVLELVASQLEYSLSAYSASHPNITTNGSESSDYLVPAEKPEINV